LKWTKIDKSKNRRYIFTKQQKKDLEIELTAIGLGSVFLGASVADFMRGSSTVMGSYAPTNVDIIGSGAVVARGLTGLYHTLRSSGVSHKQALKVVRQEGKKLKKK
jgi:hypothetical protein